MAARLACSPAPAYIGNTVRARWPQREPRTAVLRHAQLGVGTHHLPLVQAEAGESRATAEMAASAALGLLPGRLLRRSRREYGRSSHAGTRTWPVFVGNLD